MRLIDADALKEIYNGNGTFTSAHFRTAIDEMPTIKPEQKKGKWLVTGTFDGFLKCSCCKYMKPWNEDIFNFCPHCGAKMDKED